MLSILAPTRYPWRFNGPRRSRHRIDNRPFAPLNRVTPKLEGVTAFAAPPLKRYDLIHAFNRIPIGTTPYLIGFESHLPRAFSLEGGVYYRSLVRSLAGARCRAIVAISAHAERIFLDTHAESPALPTLRAKLQRRLPNLILPEMPGIVETQPWREVRLVFVGSHFGRKGGCVAARMAEMARARGFPLSVDVISALECGGGIWTDPIDPAFFEPYLKALDGPNVRWRASSPNAEVLELLSRAHFSLLTTFSDTFGYSAIESMARGTPVIATRQGALPEFIRDGESGVLIDLPVTSLGEWTHSNASGRASPAFARLFRDEVERMAEEALARVERLFADQSRYQAMRAAARATTEDSFDAESANRFWDALYDDMAPRQ